MKYSYLENFESGYDIYDSFDNNNNNLGVFPEMSGLILKGGKTGKIVNNLLTPIPCSTFVKDTDKTIKGGSGSLVCGNQNEFSCEDGNGNLINCCNDSSSNYIKKTNNQLECIEVSNKVYQCNITSGVCEATNTPDPSKPFFANSDSCFCDSTKISLQIVGDRKRKGCYTEFDKKIPTCSPDQVTSTEYNPSGSSAPPTICVYCHDVSECSIDADDLYNSNKSNCFKIEDTIKAKCPNVQINGFGCGSVSPTHGCNISTVVNPSGYETTLFGTPPCGWFGVGCGWDGEDQFCNTGGGPWGCQRGGNNKLRTLRVSGESYIAGTDDGTKGVCAIQLTKK